MSTPVTQEQATCAACHGTVPPAGGEAYVLAPGKVVVVCMDDVGCTQRAVSRGQSSTVQGREANGG